MQNTELTGADGEIVKAVQQQAIGVLSRRARFQREKRTVLEGNPTDLVGSRIWTGYEDPDIRQRLAKFIAVRPNIARRIVSAVAVVYKQNVQRRLAPQSTKRKRRAFADLNEVTRIATLAPRLNRLSYYTGPTLEVPNVRGGKPVRDLIPADLHEIAVDPENPLGSPIKAAYRWWDGPEEGAVVVLLDDMAWRYYRLNEHTPYRIVEHGLGFFPGTHWRYQWPTDPFDWWDIDQQCALQEASIEGMYLYSQLAFHRKSQNRYALFFFGDLDKLMKQGLMDPERPYFYQVGDDEDQPSFNVENMDLDPRNALNHLMFVFREQAEAHGIPQSAITYDFADGEVQPATSLQITHERQSQLRNEQIPFYEAAERRSAVHVVAVAKALRADGADDLPDPEEVRDRFLLHVPELNRIEDPKAFREQWDWERSKGLVTDVDLVLRRFPHMEAEEARTWLERQLEVQADLNEIKAARNQPSDPGRVEDEDATIESIATMNGRMGPEARDQEQDGRNRRAAGAGR